MQLATGIRWQRRYVPSAINVSDADFNNAMPNAAGVYVADTLARTDNAMFLARENMEFLLLPPQVLNSDALVMYQGEAADFAYDGPVLWHEFGHGLIHSTSDWDTVVTFDQRSSNNESSALHEGVSDLIAAMTGKRSIVGEYVGPRIDPTSLAIRNVDNQEKCPDVLWGESHQDSLHFTGAVWAARQQFLGTDNGNTFDAAFYAAIVSFPPDVNFASAASIMPVKLDVMAKPRSWVASGRTTTFVRASSLAARWPSALQVMIRWWISPTMASARSSAASNGHAHPTPCSRPNLSNGWKPW
jgi:hypothetical protein